MATKDEALAQARQLQAAIRARGVECLIDLRTGASSSGWANPKSNWRGVLGHHIVSRRAHGATRFYQLCRDGRVDVPGPLCNGYMGWDGVYRIITMGIANHSGKGGPLTLNGKTIPKDNGRYYLWGTEFEGGMEADEWTPDFHDKMARAHAGVLDWLKLPTNAHAEHKTWAPGRKNDRLGYSAELGRARIAQVRNESAVVAPAPSPVVIPAVAPTPPVKPAPTVAEYPNIPLVVDGDWGRLTTKAFQKLMAKIGRYSGDIDGIFGPMTITAMQRWLADLGYYKGIIEADRQQTPIWGSVGKIALQAFLYDKGLYRNRTSSRKSMLDGAFHGRSVTAFQSYLNEQRQYA